MHPVLIEFKGLTIYTYGFFVALGLLTAMVVTTRLAKKIDLDPDQIMDIFFYGIICGLIGARLLYVAVRPSLFLSHPLDIFKIWNGGLVFFGAVAGSFLAVIVYVRVKKLPLPKLLDLAALFAPLAHAIGRIGCFCAGCCYGKPTDLPWGVAFSDPDTLARPIGVPLHPTQLYASLTNFLIFGLLLFLFLRGRLAGRLILVYLIVYGACRSVIEIFRGDPRGTLIVDFLSTSQTIGLTAAVIAAAVLLWQTLKGKSA